MTVSAMTMAMLLTGAGEVQRRGPSAIPPVPSPVLNMPPPVPPVVYATPGPPAPPPPPTYPALPFPPQRARMNLNSYFSVDDYPAQALRDNAEGTVAVSLVIGPDGRISDCVIAVSSGSDSLDAATCRILRSRARYTPARDIDSNPTRGRDMGRVTWRLPNTE